MIRPFHAGAAVVNITPEVGLSMAGFAARSAPAAGSHDPLTARAVVVEDTAILCADVIGLHEDMSRRIRQRCTIDEDKVIVAALHTHGGPASMPGRGGGPSSASYLARLEDACVRAIDEAASKRRPATIEAGMAGDPRIARNRRHSDGVTDPSLPVLRIRGNEGSWIAVATSYACHPVVLGADNTLWTADYPGFVRDELERAHEGAVALFLTGCAADANTGHSAHSSISLERRMNRTFAEAARVGSHLADLAASAQTHPVDGAGVRVANASVELSFSRREQEPPDILADGWRTQARVADAAHARLFEIWADWAKTLGHAEINALRWSGRVTVMRWGDAEIIALPGEIFAETALSIRRRLGEPLFVVGYCEGNPGYIPPRSEFPHGGYEVDEAHRYYAMPATFAPGSAEKLAETAVELALANRRA